MPEVSFIQKTRESIHVSLDYSQDIQRYDIDNGYPQRMRRLMERSATAEACRDLMSKFFQGKGFEDERFMDSIVNFKRQTVRKLLRFIANDYARYNYFALHVNYNLNYEPVSVTRLNPEFVRMGLPDSYGFANKVLISPDWLHEREDLTDELEPDEINIFDPRPEVIQAQIDACGGIHMYKGQVFVHWGEDQKYPLSWFHSVQHELDTEYQISKSNNRQIVKGFVAKHAFVYSKKFASKEDRRKNVNQLSVAVGPDAEDVIAVDGVGELGKDFAMIPLQHNHIDGQFEMIESGARRKIMRSAGQPPILHGEDRENSMGDGRTMQAATDFYNERTEDERMVISDAFKQIFSRFFVEINPSGNYDLIPKTYMTTEMKQENAVQDPNSTEG